MLWHVIRSGSLLSTALLKRTMRFVTVEKIPEPNDIIAGHNNNIVIESIFAKPVFIDD